ncbi:hypothetical protein JOD82_001955 [Paenibacillus sp. 1182]|uniref:hypothetical protein n=1 Tax=Paenibacillus sp. 1182 TaxID=2806565 RepID=UPI001AE799AF|nr:hypothetical protein [Paenibacillus sp. 1182]MBP1308935.1 hypothetical protein [Paenibacillus sp. 1182]
MSTNYYFRNKEEYSKITKINQLVQNKIKDIVNEIGNIVRDGDEVQEITHKIEQATYMECSLIHIGKRSLGLKPLFKVQKEFSTLNQLQTFYYENKDKYEIVNEYGEVIDWNGLKTELIHWKGERIHQGSDILYDEDGYQWKVHEFS